MQQPATSNGPSLKKRIAHLRTIYQVLVCMFTGFRAQTLGQLTTSCFDFESAVPIVSVKNELIEVNGRLENTNKTAKSMKLPIMSQLEKLHLRRFVNLIIHDNQSIFSYQGTLEYRLRAQLQQVGMSGYRQLLHSLYSCCLWQVMVLPTKRKGLTTSCRLISVIPTRVRLRSKVYP